MPPPLVRGDDLIAPGLKPGPRLGEILEAVETRQLESGLRSRDEAIEWGPARACLAQLEDRAWFEHARPFLNRAPVTE